MRHATIHTINQHAELRLREDVDLPLISTTLLSCRPLVKEIGPISKLRIAYRVKSLQTLYMGTQSCRKIAKIRSREDRNRVDVAMMPWPLQVLQHSLEVWGLGG